MKGIIITVMSAILVFSLSSGYAQDNRKQYPIDRWYDKCAEKDNSTVGMRNCMGEAYEMWDKELNKNYRDLMKSLSANGKKALKNAQSQWIKYRDAEFKLVDETEGQNEGTIWLLVTDGHRLSFVRQRALELKGYLEKPD
jgi:uncharacterized protein YecT (DUF1311 family)